MKEMTYWLTRDRDIEGALSQTIDVWLAAPRLYRLTDGGVTWMCDETVVNTGDQGDCPARYAQWTTDQCIRACRVYPETERECIRVGE